MMMVATELRASSIHGIGVFLLEPIRKGQLIWRFDSRIDRVYSQDDLAGLPARAQELLRTFATYHAQSEVWVLCGDNGRHLNHCDTPNTVSDRIAFGEAHASENLPAGAELTSDYATICDHARSAGAAFIRSATVRISA
jgi:hypothetical protein